MQLHHANSHIETVSLRCTGLVLRTRAMSLCYAKLDAYIDAISPRWAKPGSYIDAISPHCAKVSLFSATILALCTS